MTVMANYRQDVTFSDRLMTNTGWPITFYVKILLICGSRDQ